MPLPLCSPAHPDRLQAVFRNDFDAMTYTTFHEFYLRETREGRPGWYDTAAEPSKPWKVKRRNLKRRNNISIAYIRNVLPTAGMLYYLRLLFKEFPAREFDDFLTHRFEGDAEDTVFESFQDAARAHNLVEDDNEAELAMLEARTLGATPSQLRHTFVVLLTQGPADACGILSTFAANMMADFQVVAQAPQQPLNEDGTLESLAPGHAQSQYNQLLLDIERRLNRLGKGNEMFELPAPIEQANMRATTELEKYLTSFCSTAARLEAHQLVTARLPTLNAEQRAVFYDLYKRLREYGESGDNAMCQELGDWGDPAWTLDVPAEFAGPVQGASNLIFLDARGGCGKTYMLNTLLAAARMCGVVALACCFTGLAGQDYPGGQTCHRLFKLPVVEGDTQPTGFSSSCSKESAHAELLYNASLIIIDECPSAGKDIAEGLCAMLDKRLGPEEEAPAGSWFGGRVVVLSGDFKQTAPVTKGADRARALNAWVTESKMWRRGYDADEGVNYRRLTQQMRQQDDPAFDAYVQRVGAGCMELDPELDAFLNPPGNRTFQSLGKAARGVRIRRSEIDFDTDRDAIISFVHPDLSPAGAVESCGCCVMSVLNNMVDAVNQRVLEMVRDGPGAEEADITECIGQTTLTNKSGEDVLDNVAVSQDFLSSMNDSAVPAHRYKLWRGSVCMIMRNLSPKLMNGTRVIVDRVGPRTVRVVEPGAFVGLGHEYAGAAADAVHYIPRILFKWDVPRTMMQVRRRQFPLRLAYAITCNKAQDKTLRRAALDLPSPPFAHGQLHVPVGRVQRRTDLRIYVGENMCIHVKDPDPTGESRSR